MAALQCDRRTARSPPRATSLVFGMSLNPMLSARQNLLTSPESVRRSYLLRKRPRQVQAVCDALVWEELAAKRSFGE